MALQILREEHKKKLKEALLETLIELLNTSAFEESLLDDIFLTSAYLSVLEDVYGSEEAADEADDDNGPPVQFLKSQIEGIVNDLESFLNENY